MQNMIQISQEHFYYYAVATVVIVVLVLFLERNPNPRTPNLALRSRKANDDLRLVIPDLATRCSLLLQFLLVTYREAANPPATLDGYPPFRLCRCTSVHEPREFHGFAVYVLQEDAQVGNIFHQLLFKARASSRVSYLPTCSSLIILLFLACCHHYGYA